jgi:hypothetical protein
MQLVVLGLNHKTAPVDIRECFSLSEDQVRHGLRRLYEYDEIYECVILSTCNRTEMYAAVDDADDALPVMEEYLASMTAGRFAVSEFLFYYKDEDCIRHLLRVAGFARWSTTAAEPRVVARHPNARHSPRIRRRRPEWLTGSIATKQRESRDSRSRARQDAWVAGSPVDSPRRG